MTDVNFRCSHCNAHMERELTEVAALEGRYQCAACSGWGQVPVWAAIAALCESREEGPYSDEYRLLLIDMIERATFTCNHAASLNALRLAADYIRKMG